MKTLKRTVMILAVLSFLAVQAAAQNAGNQPVKATKSPAKENTCGKFVDNNKNGICDNWEAGGKKNCGANFVDKNNDGICDYRQSGGKGPGNPNCTGKGPMNKNCPGNAACKGKGNCCGNGKR